MPPDPRNLRQIQRWMQSVIMCPDGVVAGIASESAREQIDVNPENVEEVITRSQAQNSVERLNVYANAYYARLLECLTKEFPALVHAVGEETFSGFAFGYLQAYPSKSYTLNDLSRNFPKYLQETRPPKENDSDQPDWADFLIDLATLGRIYSEVFDGPGVEGEQLLHTDDLLSIPSERQSEAKLIPVECLRLMRFRFPVHAYASAVRHEEAPEIPKPESTYLAITRIDYVVRRWSLSPLQFELLAALLEGYPLGEAIARAVDAADAQVEQLAAQLKEWFREWSAAGFFRAVELPG